MMRFQLRILRSLAALVLVLLPVACAGGSGGGMNEEGRAATPEPQDHAGPTIVQPGAPGEATRTVDPRELETTAGPAYTEADIRFMQMMIPHHAQALEMVDLIAERTDSEQLRRLGLRIEISQRDEIGFMKRWLRDRGREVTDYERMLDDDGRARADARDRHLMAGMLTPAQMEELARARGREFERLFLERMIMHHGGARVMVRNLFGSSGAAQATEVFTFASDVDADQMAEIRRMRRMLQELGR